jgi:hypothetical protein
MLRRMRELLRRGDHGDRRAAYLTVAVDSGASHGTREACHYDRTDGDDRRDLE